MVFRQTNSALESNRITNGLGNSGLTTPSPPRLETKATS